MTLNFCSFLKCNSRGMFFPKYIFFLLCDRQRERTWASESEIYIYIYIYKYIYIYIYNLRNNRCCPPLLTYFSPLLTYLRFYINQTTKKNWRCILQNLQCKLSVFFRSRTVYLEISLRRICNNTSLENVFTKITLKQMLFWLVVPWLWNQLSLPGIWKFPTSIYAINVNLHLHILTFF